jgi:drug/metabolite transporter (DMT)-like permease
MSFSDKQRSKPGVPPLLGLAGGILAVSTASILIRFAQTGAPSLVIAFFRLGLAAIILAPWAWRRARGEIMGLRGKELALALLSGFFLALHFAAWITSLELTSVASSVVLVTTSSLWVALLSTFVLKEKLNRYVIIGLLVALVGGTIVGLDDVCQVGWNGVRCASLGNMLDSRAMLGNLLALAGAWLAAGYLLIGRRLRAKMSLVAYTFVVYGFAALVLLVVVLAAGYRLTGYSPTIYLVFLALAVIPQLLGHSTFNWALRYLPVVYVSISLLGEPIGSTILALILLKEVPTLVTITGGILILSGIVIASLPNSKTA